MSDTELLSDRVKKLEEMLDELSGTAVNAVDLDIMWIIISSILVFFMQVGFAMVRYLSYNI